jgi:hypothetical protein
MAESRAEIRRLLEPAAEPAADSVSGPEDGGTFPRSQTMKMLLSGRGLGTLSALVGGVLVARPALALRLLRLVPTGAVARMLLVKGIAAFRARRD